MLRRCLDFKWRVFFSGRFFLDKIRHGQVCAYALLSCVILVCLASSGSAASIEMSLLINLEAEVLGQRPLDRLWRQRWLKACRALNTNLLSQLSQSGISLPQAPSCSLSGKPLRGAKQDVSHLLQIRRDGDRLRLDLSQNSVEEETLLVFTMITQPTQKPLALLASKGFALRFTRELQKKLESGDVKQTSKITPDENSQAASSGEVLYAPEESYFASGYFNFRYGRPLLNEGLFVKKASALDLQFELRDGPLGGLYFSFLTIPKVIDRFKDLELAYESQRMLLGWTFGLALSSFITRIDLSTMLGLWTYRFDLPLSPEADKAFSYKLLEKPTLGLRLGMESEGVTWLVRVWAGVDQTLGFLQASSVLSNITSLRGGAEIFYQGPNLGFADLDFFVFATQDQVSLSQKSSSEEVGSPVLQAVHYSHFFAGPGLALTW